MARITILNGPNLNLLGTRDPEIYGGETLADVEAMCRATAEALGHEAVCAQSNSEGGLVDMIQAARQDSAGLVINAGAYTHTSVAIHDALEIFAGPVIEVHISNVHHREAFRHRSFVTPQADGVIVGCGTQGYDLAIRRLAQLIG